MNVLLLSVYEIGNSDSGYIYADLVREFALHGHNVVAVCPTSSENESFVDKNGVKIIKIKNGQIQKTGKIKKVVNLLTLESRTIKTVKRNTRTIKFDLVVYMSSNLSYVKTAAYFKKRDGAKNYMLQKDIFPQNAVDMEMMRTNGFIGVVYRHFRNKEKEAYENADFIGCMSKANVDYLVKHNPKIPVEKFTVVPNCIAPKDLSVTDEEKFRMREKYGIPQNKTVFVYGGNLGKPQGIPFIIDCLRSVNENKAFFLLVGDGTEFEKLREFVDAENHENVKLMKRLPREDFDTMLAACDVGLIFLDHRFTIPNYPSRLLSYMQAGLPVIACTDPNTDVGKDIVNGGFGWWCESDDLQGFGKIVRSACVCDLHDMGQKAKVTLYNRFDVGSAVETIVCGVSE